jgi:cytochrome c553
MDAATIETSLKGYKAGTLNQKGMGSVMKGQVATYSDADMAAVAAYISTLK